MTQILGSLPEPHRRGALAPGAHGWPGAHRTNLDSASVAYLEEDLERGGLDLLHYWNLALKWRWVIAAAMATGLLAGVVATLLTTPLYFTSATVQIDAEPQKVVAIESQRSSSGWSAEQNYYQTQYELLKSRALAERVVEKTNLANDAAFMNQWGRSDASVESSPPTEAERRARLQRAAGLVSGGLKVEPVRGSRMVRIGYESPDPAVAAKVANAVAETYIVWNMERRFEAAADARRFLENRLEQTRQTLEAAQRRANEHAQKNQLITVTGTGGAQQGSSAISTGESLVAADLNSVNQSLAEATNQRIQAEQRWRQASATAAMSLPEVLSNPSIQTLKATRDAAWAEYQQNLRIYKPEFPTMVEAKAKIDAMDQQIAAQVNTIRDSLRIQYEVARRNEAQLRGEVERRKSELLASQGKRVEQSFINTDINTTQALYDAMLASYKEIGIAGGMLENNISVVDRAEAPGGPFKPQPMRNLAMFGFLGLALGAGLAFVLDKLDLSIKVPEEIEKTLGVPLLGTIPLNAGDVSPAKALDDPKSRLAEAYSSVRTALQFSTEDGAPSSLLITSSRAGEGKSVTSVAIAKGFARLGMQVLLIDGDMRDPSLHKLLSRDNGVGLSNLLAGGPDMAPALQPTGVQNLTFLACGPLPPNPAELLGGGRMRSFLAAAREQFDLVVIDGPPVMGLADAPQLAHVVQGTAIVVEAAKTKRDMARAAVRRLRLADARLVGALLTKFDLKKAGYAYGYAHGYGYGYGYGYDYGSRPEPVRRFTKIANLAGLLPKRT